MMKNKKFIKNAKKHFSVSADKNKLYLYLILGALIVAIIAISVALVIHNSRSEEESGPIVTDEVAATVTTKPTEEEEDVTKATLDKYAEVNIDGYMEDTFGDDINEAIVVSLKNKSEEKVSLTVEIIAINQKGEVVDSSYLSAENMNPGETQSFPMFTSSSIPMNELKNMEFKVYRAYTYDPTPREAPVENTPTEENINAE
jgi:hypothetical protein